tara:strand:+ start:4281 stop:5921 length:1641 start_codon:yes stop_codon:yes gene_type:complete
MSYLALARKWRPRTFADVMGQDHVVKALSHALDGDKLHPAILLTGTRGVGKTTLARIVSKGLNCETGVSAQPCGTCSACQEVNDGRFVDLLEIDAASNTGVDNVRELIDNSQYSPARGRYKIYLIDEVHMLSKSAFNALLKTLEEPPPHVKFILATTDPQKLPITVLSRCLQFNLKRLPVSVIRDQLSRVLEQEGIDFEPSAVNEIARAADGSMRDGLSLVDQAIAFAGGARLERGPIEDMLGTSGRQVLYTLLGAVSSGDGEALLEGISQLETRAPDYFALLNDLAAYVQRIAVLLALPGARSEDDDEELLALTEHISAEDAQLYYQIAVSGRRDLPWAPDPRSGFEMTLLRMLLFRPDDSGSAPARSGSGSVSSGQARSGASESSAAKPASTAKAAKRPTVEAKTQPPEPPAPPPADLPWSERIDTLGLDVGTRQLARQCVWAGHEGNHIKLRLAESARFLLNKTRQDQIEAGLQAQFGASVQLQIELDRAAEEEMTPAQAAEAEARRAQAELIDRVTNDPVVSAFREQFGASVRPGSIQPKTH